MKQTKSRKPSLPTKEEFIALTKEVKNLRQSMEKTQKWYASLLRGIVLGFGTLIGATIIASVVLLLIHVLIQKTGLDQLIDPEFIEQMLKK